jgi:response regulator RpfG family c-di-GMP phosphodiesterase
MKLSVLILEDEAAVRDALIRDLAPLAEVVRVEGAEDVHDARAVLDEVAADGDVLALVLADHRLPGTSGVDFLVELHEDPASAPARKVLVTGQADLEDTVKAVNRASLDRYIAKPWAPEELVEVTRQELTAFVLATDLDPLPHLRALDAAQVLPRLRGRGDR